jgi:tetratricopeptide (TPR) repeat protein
MPWTWLPVAGAQVAPPPSRPKAATVPRTAEAPAPVRTPRPARPALAPHAETLWGLHELTPLARGEWLEERAWEAREEALRATEEMRFEMEWQRDRMREQAEERGAALAQTLADRRWDLEVNVAPQVRVTPRPLADARWDVDVSIAPELRLTPRPAWARGDQGDSLYRRARELLNQGEYRRAAAAFRDITDKTPNSAYAADALYWQAFALYRMGGTAELRSALEALSAQRTKYPGARMQAETDALSVRIRGALAARGDATAAQEIRTAARGDSALLCDREEQAVRVEALNALTQSDPTGARPLLDRILARKDECSAMLRRTAVFLVGSKQRDAGAAETLARVARSDPSVEVRASAMEWLARLPGEDALGTLEELSRDSDERIQRSAVRALVRHQSTRARQLVRGIVDRSETPERLRLEALSAFDKERSTSEDITWMRALYGRTENPRIKARIVSTLSNIGGSDVDQWLLAVARNTDESSETRRYAIRRVGRTLPIAELAKLYDASAERVLRESLIETLGNRAEAEATDKLIDIVKTGTDPQLRRQAISVLTRRSEKDPRTMRLLMEIIDK